MIEEVRGDEDPKERVYIERKPNYSEEVTYLLELGIAETLLVRAGMASLETAEARFHTVLEMDPGNIEALNLLAQICGQHRGRWQTAFRITQVKGYRKQALLLSRAVPR